MIPTTTSSTAAPPTTHRPGRSGLPRILDVARIHVVAWPLLIAVPVAIVAVTFAINYTIQALIDTDGSTQGTGAILALYGFVVAFYVQAVTQTFPFYLGLSVTRREFFVATGLVAVAQSALFAGMVQVLSVIEAATDGWGVRLRMFGVLRWVTDSSLLQFLGYFATLLLTTAIATAAGAVFQRWRALGLTIAGIASIVVFGGAAIVVTWARWWPAVTSWFADTPRAVVLVGLPVAVTLAVFAAAWGVLRRSTT
ncbi:ABC transporter permease [Prescottella subtropica]|uniref:ABC transporter permease n=1 Tax=Prescottella subtropica TaxID=2545757 RepID=UPI0010FA3C4B|nr:ABC transporter permease [Prescottella subtropica]